ncbi:hypothetical protein CDD80_6931 [Ophiocordyceps camponoti-rufipedis]|uniref:GH16 domain-containing protein n=1 Tax=Ophiocordyceps camponoti-rufipedis TaxID=2004952 RepID=A0A2C5ZEG5_9HYPO|nr:hypothetical protein CDD80_6931 [Ophiocordyceps camponoti-rufipedis]
MALVRLTNLLLLTGTAAASVYNLQQVVNSTNFNTEFEFLTKGRDPEQPYDDNKSWVRYQSLADALAKNLTNTNDGQIYLGVDHTNKLPLDTPGGRDTFRVQSTKTYNKGLFIMRYSHMPKPVCGSWPAVGEVDLYEGWDLNSANRPSFHSGTPDEVGKCGLDRSLQGAEVVSLNCDNKFNETQPEKQGCQVKEPSNGIWGSKDGGVQALLWTDTELKVWTWPSTLAPPNLDNPQVDPSTWGKPSLHLARPTCDVNAALTDQRLILNVAFCPGWGWDGGSNTPSCAATTGTTCQKFVAENPDEFKDVYFRVVDFRYFLAGVSDLGASTATNAEGHSSTSLVSTSETEVLSVPSTTSVSTSETKVLSTSSVFTSETEVPSTSLASTSETEGFFLRIFPLRVNSPNHRLQLYNHFNLFNQVFLDLFIFYRLHLDSPPQHLLTHRIAEHGNCNIPGSYTAETASVSHLFSNSSQPTSSSTANSAHPDSSTSLDSHATPSLDPSTRGRSASHGSNYPIADQFLDTKQRAARPECADENVPAGESTSGHAAGSRGPSAAPSFSNSTAGGDGVDANSVLGGSLGGDATSRRKQAAEGSASADGVSGDGSTGLNSTVAVPGESDTRSGYGSAGKFVNGTAEAKLPSGVSVNGERISGDDAGASPDNHKDNHSNPGDNHSNPGDNYVNPGDNPVNPGDNHVNPGDNPGTPPSPNPNTNLNTPNQSPTLTLNIKAKIAAKWQINLAEKALANGVNPTPEACRLTSTATHTTTVCPAHAPCKTRTTSAAEPFITTLAATPITTMPEATSTTFRGRIRVVVKLRVIVKLVRCRKGMPGCPASAEAVVVTTTVTETCEGTGTPTPGISGGQTGSAAPDQWRVPGRPVDPPADSPVDSPAVATPTVALPDTPRNFLTQRLTRTITISRCAPTATDCPVGKVTTTIETRVNCAGPGCGATTKPEPMTGMTVPSRLPSPSPSLSEKACSGADCAAPTGVSGKSKSGNDGPVEQGPARPDGPEKPASPEKPGSPPMGERVNDNPGISGKSRLQTNEGAKSGDGPFESPSRKPDSEMKEPVGDSDHPAPQRPVGNELFEDDESPLASGPARHGKSFPESPLVSGPDRHGKSFPERPVAPETARHGKSFPEDGPEDADDGLDEFSDELESSRGNRLDEEPYRNQPHKNLPQNTPHKNQPHKNLPQVQPHSNYPPNQPHKTTLPNKPPKPQNTNPITNPKQPLPQNPPSTQPKPTPWHPTPNSPHSTPQGPRLSSSGKQPGSAPAAGCQGEDCDVPGLLVSGASGLRVGVLTLVAAVGLLL